MCVYRENHLLSGDTELVAETRGWAQPLRLRVCSLVGAGQMPSRDETGRESSSVWDEFRLSGCERT